MKIITGIVTSTKMAKTATVSVTRFVAHPLYKKRMRRTKLYQVHDEVGHKIGEQVNFVACAPVSKSKKWKILEATAAAAKKETKEVVKKEVKAKVAKPKAQAKKTTKKS